MSITPLMPVYPRCGFRPVRGLRRIQTRLFGARLEPTQFSLSMREKGAVGGAGGQIEFDRLQLQPLRDLATYMPLPARWRADLARFSPRGTLTRGHLQWDGETEAPSSMEASAEFSDLGVTAQDSFPGASGLTGSFDVRHNVGEIKLATEHFRRPPQPGEQLLRDKAIVLQIPSLRQAAVGIG